MSISKSPSVRYATVAFKDVQGEDLNPFKLIAIINGIVEYFEISHTDFIGRSDQEDIIEQLLNDKKDPGVKNGQ